MAAFVRKAGSVEKKMSDTAEWLVSHGAQILRASKEDAYTVAQVLLANRCVVYADQVMYDDGAYDIVFYFMRDADVRRVLEGESKREDLRATLAAPDAVVWANAFVAHKKAMDWSKDMIDERLMAHWFANFALGGLPPDIDEHAGERRPRTVSFEDHKRGLDEGGDGP